MKIVKIKPITKCFSKRFVVPGDKSISHRAVMLAALATGTSHIEGFLPGADCLHTVEVLRQLGVEIIQKSATSLQIKGRGWSGLTAPSKPLYVGNSGTTIRLMLGILAACPFSSTIYGDASIAKRPMGRIIRPLQLMGADVQGESRDTLPPVTVRGGGLQGISFANHHRSAQVKTSLLFAGLQAQGITRVEESVLSRNHTELMLPSFGIPVEIGDGFVSVSRTKTVSPANLTVPGDFSSAAFLIAAGAMVPESTVQIDNVGLNETRTGLVDVLLQMGAEVTIEQTGYCGLEPIGSITIKSKQLRGTTIEGAIIPRLLDEIPLVAVLATQAEGRTVIKDAAELKVKESNRLVAIAHELVRLGANIAVTADGLVIEGPTTLHGKVRCESHGDHRIAMSLAIAGLVCADEIAVSGLKLAEISYPGFRQTLASLY